MLENTFIHIPGIGEKAERLLWGQGCMDWATLRGGLDQFSVGSVEREILVSSLDRSIGCLERGEHQYFSRALGLKEAWRAFPEFRSKCVYLDIETDGGQSGSSITTIGLYDGQDYRCLVKGQDLGNFPDIISHYSMIVTFFGAGFDLPMLKKCFHGIDFDQIHLDLCPTLRRIGLRGGLKKIEVQLGISRADDTQGLNGLDAIRLWRRYQHLGDEGALETLIAYNREDVVNLETLALYAYKNLREQAFQPLLLA